MLAKDDVDEAKNVARESRDIFQDLEDAAGEARSLNVILSANMLHDEDFVDALFAAKDVLFLFRGGEIDPEDEDKKAIADGLHAQAKVHLSVGELKESQEAAQEAIKYYEQAKMTPKEAAYGMGGALQTLAHAYCLEGEPDLGLPHNERAAELFAAAEDATGEAMARAVMAYQDTMSRMKTLEDAPGSFTEQSNQRVTDNWTVMDDAMAMMRELRDQEGEDQIGSLIYEANQKVG
ncbi:ankrd29, partial [Symbiodinium pilosum]